MNYLYFYNGKIPKYVNYSLESVKYSDPEAKIFFCSDSKPSFKELTHIDLQDLSSEHIKFIKELNYFNNNKNPLWETSLLRIYYLLSAAEFLKIKNFVHFDTDVMIYKSFKDIKNSFVDGKLNITPLNELFLIFGYSYISSIETYKLICENMIKILEKIEIYQKKYYENKKINEMLLLNLSYFEQPDNFNLLNITPNQNSNILFDPISYGQYISGIDKKNISKKTIDEDHYVGREVLRSGMKIFYRNNKPQVKYKNKTYEIANSHVHKKNLKDYVPK